MRRKHVELLVDDYNGFRRIRRLDLSVHSLRRHPRLGAFPGTTIAALHLGIGPTEIVFYLFKEGAKSQPNAKSRIAHNNKRSVGLT